MSARSLAFRTEIEFTLPKGYLDEEGVLHRQGVMRLATAADEILPLRDPRVQQNPAYLTIIVMARVIVRLGSLPEVDTKVVEGVYAADLDYLQRLYEQINAVEETDSPGGVPVPPMMAGPSRLQRAGNAPMGEA
jgi:hypothetical protein